MTAETQKPARLPPRWIVKAAWKFHRGLYKMTGGRFGLRKATDDKWGMMRLTVTGRRSGQERTVILGYYEDGDNLVTMAMNGWGGPEPAWWLNLQANPDASVELGGRKNRPVTGRAAVGEERDRLWDRWRHYDKNLDEYAARRPEETAVVMLEPR
ncbi:MAG: nitroreductase family deazaflavin-dependent oxidoreductase [Acidimicrobiia bacterium]|nr:nitroreductase family deazaflavin-dependent oxidoreductase [Acidimicrobiia bacterium]